MNQLAAWAPTIVSVIAAILFGGGLIRDVKSHGKILDKHTDEINSNALEIAKLSAWRDGFNAATHRG